MEHLECERRRRLTAFFTILADAVFYFFLSTLLEVGIYTLNLPDSDLAQLFPLRPWFFPSALGLALGLNFWVRRTQRRLVSILSANLLFYGTLVLLVLLLLRDTLSLAFIPQAKLLFSGQAGVANLANFWLTLIMLAIALIRTYQKSGQYLKHAEALTRFELSIVALFGLALLFSLLQIPMTGGMPWLLAGFLANGVALSLAPTLALPQKPFWLGPFVLVILLLPMAVLGPLILPYLSSPAEVILRTSRPVLDFLLKIFLAVITLLLGWGHMIPETSSASNSAPPSGGLADVPTFTPSSWMNQIKHFLLVGGGILLVLASLLLFSYLVYRFLRYLFRLREPEANWASSDRFEPGWKTFLHLLVSWLRWLKITLPWRITPSWRTKVCSREAYHALQRWGKQHHLPREPSETPYEYQERLIQRFPSKVDSLNLITELYVQHAYGNPNSIEPRSSELLRALQRLYHR
ncbi:MAG TPA: DUF4129 domain-containing protein [Desulfosporosinus sp.]|nr:DUF4129 domain-containing protein [Desulfosporosinus sp.]